jgi:hypothetical protein
MSIAQQSYDSRNGEQQVKFDEGRAAGHCYIGYYLCEENKPKRLPAHFVPANPPTDWPKEQATSIYQQPQGQE